MGGDLQRPLLAALLLRHRQLAAAERRRRDAEGVGRRPRLHDPAAQGREVPQRPAGRRRRLQVRLGAGARPQDRELGGELHLHDQGRQGALPPPGPGAHRRRGRRRLHAPGDAHPARHHVRLRAHAAVHGAGAQGGGRPAGRRLRRHPGRQRPVQGRDVRLAGPALRVHPVRRLLLEGPPVPRRGRVPVGHRPERPAPHDAARRARPHGLRPERPEPRRDPCVRPAQEVPLRAAAPRLAVDQHAPARRGVPRRPRPPGAQLGDRSRPARAGDGRRGDRLGGAVPEGRPRRARARSSRTPSTWTAPAACSPRRGRRRWRRRSG